MSESAFSDDSITPADTRTITADVDAGAGNDSVTTGAGKDVVTGGDGDDLLTGGAGNDFQVGGLGADLLSGLTGDDILVSGTATVASPPDSVRQVLTACDPATPGIYADLRSRLIVTDDPAATDTLTGGVGTDWFWSADGLDVLDREAGEELKMTWFEDWQTSGAPCGLRFFSRFVSGSPVVRTGVSQRRRRAAETSVAPGSQRRKPAELSRASRAGW